jgi:hypothetical protein
MTIHEVNIILQVSCITLLAVSKNACLSNSTSKKNPWPKNWRLNFFYRSTFEN